MPDETTEGNNKKNQKSNKILLIICIVAAIIIIALIGIILTMMHSRNSVGEAESAGEKRPVVIVEENVEEVVEQILNQTEPEGIPLQYQVTMNSTWEFENGQSASKNAYVANSTDNETAVYFDVVRNDTHETIYQSPVIPVGKDLSSITLDKDLNAGNYECTLTYYLIDDEQNILTTVNMWVMVQIDN